MTIWSKGHLAMLISYMNLFNDVAQYSDIFTLKLVLLPVPGGVPQLGVGYLGCRVTVEKIIFTLNCFIVGFILPL